MDKTEKRIKELRKLLEYHSDRYYNKDDPEISDFEYDMMMQELKALEKERPELASEQSPTAKVGGKASAMGAVRHRNPMLSLQDVFDKGEVEKFVFGVKEKLPGARFVVETKIDGLSMSLRYENGELSLAETRGDGIEFGEDVTANARVIGDVAEKLTRPVPYLEVRGEVYMSRKAFEEVNEKQELLGKKQFANPRNCAAGTLRQLDSQIVKERNLSLFIFNIQELSGETVAGHYEGYRFLKELGITPIEHSYLCETFEEVWDAIEKIGEMRGSLEYDIDGAVVKLDNLTDRDGLGTTAKTPKWAVAYKYPPERKESKIESIEVSVGRTGKLTPTAIIEPVRLCGTTVSRVMLHNQDFIDKFNIAIGSTIIVEKSGEIIPKCLGEVAQKHPAGVERFKLPDVCPVCGSPALREEGTADIRCTGASCPAQTERHIINFVGRDAMDIKGLGASGIHELIERGYLKDVADIFTLKDHREALIEEGVVGKEKNTAKLLEAIEGAKSREASRLLTGLGIPNVGKGAAKDLIDHFRTIDAIEQADVEALLEVEDVGEITAKAVRQYFDVPENRELVARLRSLGVNMAGEEKAEGGKLTGFTFVITGTLPSLGRAEAQKLIEDNGGKVSGSVSKKTDYLLAGEAAGSKLTKAQELGTKIIDEDELYNMLGITK